MADKKTDVQPSKTADENETQVDETKNEESQTDEDTEGTSTEGEDVENKEGDYYEEELKRLRVIEEEKKKLEEDLAEQKRRVEIKDRALQAEKKKAKPEASLDKEAIKQELRTELRVEREIERVGSTEAERQLIQHHYQNSIVKTGNVVDDIRNAVAVANAKRISELLGRQSAEDAAENTSASSMLSGGMQGASGGSRIKSPAQKIAENTLKHVSPEAAKRVKNYLR